MATEDNLVNFNKEIMEAFLKTYERHKSILRVIETERVKDNFGAHFISNTWRQKSKVIQKNGEERNVFVVVKAVPTDESSKQFLQLFGLFGREIKIYTEVLPAMEKLMRDNADYGEHLWPKCIGYQANRCMILEDVTCSNYKKVKVNRLDLDHSVFVIRCLAKFHALSVILKDNSCLETYHFDRLPYLVIDDKSVKQMETKYKCYAKVLREKGGQEWVDFANKLENLGKTITVKLVENVLRQESDFNVLNHGDIWPSNLLFKYNEFSNELEGIKFLDFQMVHYSSHALDLQYFMHLGVERDVKEENYNQLLEAYYETLRNTFTQYHHEPVYLPTLEEIKKEMKRKLIFGVFHSLTLIDIWAGEDYNKCLEVGEEYTFSELFIERLFHHLEPYKNFDFDSL